MRSQGRHGRYRSPTERPRSPEQLTLSIRTVEGHVYRACYKLGVADRDELAELMRPEPAR